MGKLTVLVCGGGNGAHVIAGLAASRENTEVRVMTLYEDEAERWTNILKEEDLVIQMQDGDETKEIKTKPGLITKDPKKAVPGADMIIFIVPAFAHAQYFEAIVPHIEPNTTIIGLPGQPGFEFQLYDVLKQKAKRCAILSFESLPWACRIVEFGKRVQILGMKACLLGSTIMAKSKPKCGDPVEAFQKILGESPELKQMHNYLEPYLTTKAIIHPPIMYGYWKDWDGKPLEKKPLFYQGIDDKAAGYLSGVSDELVATAKAISEKCPKFDLSKVTHLYAWYLVDWCDNISDKTNLKTCMQTNSAYDGLLHPMLETEEGKYVPNFGYRYLTEDIPDGLVVTKGLALIAGVKTPVTDEVLLWCQEKLGKEYLVGTELKGKDLNETRCPQRYGFKTLDNLANLI